MALHYEVRMLWRIISDDSEFLELPDLFYPSDDEGSDEEIDEESGWMDSEDGITDIEDYGYASNATTYVDDLNNNQEYINIAGALMYGNQACG